MSVASRALPPAAVIMAAMLLALPSTAVAQAPTLPSDTLSANYAPPSEMAPMPEYAPSLPSDTIEIGAPLEEGYDPMVTDSLNPGPAPEDSTADLPAPSPY
jgi:hypothetical protein